jgi:hypothetical protein
MNKNTPTVGANGKLLKSRRKKYVLVRNEPAAAPPPPAAVPPPAAAPPPPAAPVPLEQLAIMKPVVIKDTLSQGDCFYSGIFRSLSERDLLEHVGSCLSVNTVNEPVFIEGMRNKLADMIASGNLLYSDEKNGRLDIYDSLMTALVNRKLYRSITRNFPSWFNVEFGKYGDDLGTRESFCQRLASHIRTPGQWVGEIEVRFVKEMLTPCNIELRIEHSIKDRLTEQNNGQDIIYLYNPNEQHYKYFSFSQMGLDKQEANVANEAEVNTTSTCVDLYDPCTREPISSMEALEKRIRELKKMRDLVPVGLYGLTNETTNYDFLTTVFINPNISLDDMVSFRLSSGGQIGSDIYEVLSRLFVFFGGIQNVNPRQDGNYRFMKKIEGGGSEVYDDSVEALRLMKCKATRAMGISDITLTNIKSGEVAAPKPHDPYCEVECNIKETEIIKTYLISVKWYKNEKNAEYYDLEKLFTAAQKITSAEQKPVDIIVFLKSKHDFEIAHNRAYRQYTRDIAKTFFGWNEDVKPFLEEKRRAIFEFANLTNKTPLEALQEQYFRPNAKPILSLQLHQDIIVKGMCDTIQSSGDNLYLVGVLPRGGKTYIAGGIIREYLQRNQMEKLNILWLTAAPNETLTQVRDDLIYKFNDFQNFEFVDIREGRKETNNPHTVFFCSSQLLIASEKPTPNQRQFLEDLKRGANPLGLVFFDEAHKTGTGDITRDKLDMIIQNYIRTSLPIIFLTATYYNILFDYQIQKSNTFLWDYTDVLASRSLATETEQAMAIVNLQNRFGKELVDEIIAKRITNKETLETMAKAYIGFPDLLFISADFQAEALSRFSEQAMYRPDAGFSLSSIFAIREGTTLDHIKTDDNKIRPDAYRIFNNITNPKNMISLITPRETFDSPEILDTEGGEPLTKEEGTILEPSLLGRINKLSSDTNSRFRLDEHPTLLMFMPTGGTGTNIFYLLCAWASLLRTHKWWRDNYEIACIVSDDSIQGADGIHMITRNAKAHILTLERSLHCRPNPKGLLLLAGEKLSMGVSLPCTDVVFLFNEKKSPDDIIQKMYRALTPSPGKTSAFVVDLNPVRTLAAVYGYTRASHTTANTSSDILDIIYDTYSWDSDVFEYNLSRGAGSMPLTFQDKLRHLFEMAERDPSNAYRINEDMGGFEKRLGDNIKRGMSSEFVNKLVGQISSKKVESVLERIGLKEGSKVSLERGQFILRVPRPPGESEESPAPNEDIEIVIDNFIETIADFVKYLAITSSAPTLVDALEEYETGVLNHSGSSLRQNVMRLVRTRSTIKEGEDKDLLSKLMVTAVKEIAFTSSEQIFRQMKGKFDDHSLRKDKILAIIHKRLTPRKKQKKEAGEVFTPIELIEKLMTHLPKSVWSNPDLKWIDPANGIGNFPVVVFYKLDEGLKSWEPNEKKRRKHIIENMLYMIELQSNNSRIARRIFETLCEGCKPNILTTDSSNLTSAQLKAKGFPEKYDIVMGNPPFQKGRNMMFYVYFIDLANRIIKDNGYLVYVIPNKILIQNRANEAIHAFNPLFIYHTLNSTYFPSISTTICGIICRKSKFEPNTTVKFSNGEMTVNLDTPTPTQYDDIRLKKLSDKILFGKGITYLPVTKSKPAKEHIYISRVWERYSPDKPGGGGTHVFKISDSPTGGDDGSGRYVEIPKGITKSLLKWVLSRSEAMRFITKIYAGAMNVPAFIWDMIPYIPVKSESDSEVYRRLNLSDADIKMIRENMKDNKEPDDTQEGGAHSRSFTRKLRRV